MAKGKEELTNGTPIVDANIVSQHPHENPILAKLGYKESNASFGIGTSFESLPVEVVIEVYDEFMVRHKGQDWILEGRVGESKQKVRIK